jgi:hypothetical protein
MEDVDLNAGLSDGTSAPSEHEQHSTCDQGALQHVVDSLSRLRVPLLGAPRSSELPI